MKWEHIEDVNMGVPDVRTPTFLNGLGNGSDERELRTGGSNRDLRNLLILFNIFIFLSQSDFMNYSPFYEGWCCVSVVTIFICREGRAVPARTAVALTR